MTTTEQIAALTGENERLQKENAALMEKVAKLMQDLESFRKMLFGQKSEKRLPYDPAQLNLFGDGEKMTEEERARLEQEVRRAEEEIRRTIQPKAKPARKPLDTSSLPVEEHHIYPEGTTDENGNLKEGYEELKPEVTERLERIPSKFYIVRTIRHCVVRKTDGKRDTDRGDILIAALPLTPIYKCIAGASVLTDIIISKYLYHLPLYRLIRLYREGGFNTNDSTIGEWCKAVLLILEPLYDLLKRKILESEYIQVDESLIPVIDDEKHRAVRGYIWVVRDGITGAAVFHYDGGSRNGEIADRLLGAYQGILQSDGYNVYDRFDRRDGVTSIGCWAHARRKFVEALNENKTLATQALSYIAKLYKVESDADEAGLSPDERGEKRRREAYPVLRAFEEWLHNAEGTVLPKSRMGKAINYAVSNMARLSRYVNDGRVNIDNNLVENAIRPMTIGRKNYLFCGNNDSACRTAIAYSLISTCKAVEVDPRAWMEDVLRKIPYYQRDGKDMAELLPMNWAKSTPTPADLSELYPSPSNFSELDES